MMSVTGTISKDRLPSEATMRQLEKIAQEHNGVFGVYLFMGHDGHSSVKFTNQDGLQICRGESGASLDDAARRCIDRWRILSEARNVLVDYGDGGAAHD